MIRHCLFVGHILYGRNNVYEESLIASIGNRMDSLDVVSVNKALNIPADLRNRDIHILWTCRKPILDEIVRFFKFLHLSICWCLRYDRKSQVMVLLSAPVEINLVAALLRSLLGIKVVNLVIDTAQGNIRTNRIWDRYIKLCYRISESMCKRMSASMALNARVFPYLRLNDKPCLLTRIGHSVKQSTFAYRPSRTSRKVLAYTGTLIYYDGTRALLDAMTLLDPEEYELHIYGRGPDEALVKEYQCQYPHIQLKGYLPNSEINRVLSDADLLINPRIDNEMTDIFGFPSKMIEYLLSGTPVLTTRFAAMPDDYLDFVYLIDRQDGQGIAHAIKRVFEEPEAERKERCQKAYAYVFSHNDYETISDEMVSFFDSI